MADSFKRAQRLLLCLSVLTGVLVGCGRQPAERSLEPTFPAGMTAHDLVGAEYHLEWLLSPNRTAAKRRASDLIICDFETNEKLRLAVAGGAYVWWSPDERWILYWNRGWCFVRRDGQVHKRLTNVDDRRPDCEPLWRPGATQVLLPKGTQLVSPESDTIRVLAKNTIWSNFVSWSPDGRLLFYSEWNGRNYSNVGIAEDECSNFGYISPDGEEHWKVVVKLHDFPTLTPSYGKPSWSSDCTKMVMNMRLYDGQISKWVACVFDLEQRQAVVACEAMCNFDGEDSVVVSPNGTWVGGLYYTKETYDLEVVNVESKRRWRIHDGDVNIRQDMQFSPDSKWLAITYGGAIHTLSTIDSEAISYRGPFIPAAMGSKITEWKAEPNEIHYVDGVCSYALRLDGTCTRIWPDGEKVQTKVTRYEHTFVELEQSEIPKFTGRFVRVPSEAEDVPAEFKDLPIQVASVK